MAEFKLEIEGEYGENDGTIHLLIDGAEIVMWDSAEWAEDPSLVYVIANAIRKGFEGTLVTNETCIHCGRAIVRISDGDRWIDPQANGDDSVWRETCDEHDTFTAEHEPDYRSYVPGHVYLNPELGPNPMDKPHKED